MKFEVDYDKCIGIGMCEAVASGIFAVKDDGTLDVLVDVVPEDERAVLEEAIAVCPTSAIRLIGD
ncbi:ferredoxin [Paenarthrobacter sp. NPDC091711]|uniref:ferredoxin n=1 Tax=Paenarthrobacter sp. NPDC091711 TaxID=3364385 RepID=UPI0038272984